MHDDLARAGVELAARIRNPAAAEGLPNTTEEHAQYVLDLAEKAPKPLTPEQEAAATALAELQAQRARVTVTAAIEGDDPDATVLEALDRKIEIADGLARGDSAA